MQRAVVSNASSCESEPTGRHCNHRVVQAAHPAAPYGQLQRRWQPEQMPDCRHTAAPSRTRRRTTRRSFRFSSGAPATWATSSAWALRRRRRRGSCGRRLILTCQSRTLWRRWQWGLQGQRRIEERFEQLCRGGQCFRARALRTQTTPADS